MTVQVNDKGYNRIKQQVLQYSKLYAKVGVQTDALGYENGTSVAKVAHWQEFGTADIPARPFMRLTVNEESANWANLLEKGYEKILDGKSTATDEIHKVAILARDDIKDKIYSNIQPENAPATKLKKGGSVTAKTNTLIDTGRLVASINYRVLSKTDV